MDPNRPRIAPTLDPVARTPSAPPAAPVAPAPPEQPVLHLHRPSVWQRIRRGLLWLVLTLFLLALAPPGAVLWLRWHAPPTTAFMLQSAVQPVQYHWVPKEQIPETLRLAVIAAEDQKFWTHWGFDFIAIAEALEHNEKSKRKRGASTITQQTAKNLFLWPSRSWLRKGLEVTFTLLLEGLWTKDRILEVYLNVAEFGPGIYGVEAAAQKFFGKPAEKLTPAETAQLAAVLPNPRKWHADRPGPYVQARVDWILVHIGQRPRFSAFPEPEPEAPAGEPGAELPEEGAASGPPEATGADVPAEEGAEPTEPEPAPAEAAPVEPPTDEELPPLETEAPPPEASAQEAPRY